MLRAPQHRAQKQPTPRGDDNHNQHVIHFYVAFFLGFARVALRWYVESICTAYKPYVHLLRQKGKEKERYAQHHALSKVAAQKHHIACFQVINLIMLQMILNDV